MKRPSTVFACLLLAAALPASASSYRLTVSSVSAHAGETAAVTVALERGATLPSALFFTLDYDAARLAPAAGAQPVPLVSSPFRMIALPLGEGQLGVAVFSSVGALAVIPDGPLIQVPLTVRSDAGGFAKVAIGSSPPPDAADALGHLLTPLVSTSESGITITPNQATLHASPAVIDFGSVPPGTPLTRDVIFTNVGTAPLSITRFSLGSGCEKFHVRAPALPLVLQAGQSAAVPVDFSSAEEETYGGRLYVDYAAPAANVFTMPLLAATSSEGFVYATKIVVPAFARIDQGNGTGWRSSLTLYNDSAFPAGVRLTFHPSGSAPVAGPELRLEPRQSADSRDALLDLLGQEEGNGALVVEASSPDVAVRSAITHLLGGGASAGESVPAVDWTGLFHSGERAVLAGLERTAARRTSVAALNFSATPVTIRATVLSADGTEIGRRDYVLGPAGIIPSLNLFDALGIEERKNLTVVLTSESLDATFFGYASTVDNATGSPLFQSPR